VFYLFYTFIAVFYVIFYSINTRYVLLPQYVKVNDQPRGLVVRFSLSTNHEVPGSIPGSTVGIFPEGEDSRGDHGLGRLVEFRLKGPPGTTSSYITTHIIGTT